MCNRPHAHDDSVASACSLDAGQLSDRVHAWQHLMSRVISRSVRPGHVTSVYPRDEDVIERLTQLIEAERECCPFLRFTVREDADVVHVDLEYPDGFDELLRSVVGSGSATERVVLA